MEAICNNQMGKGKKKKRLESQEEVENCLHRFEKADRFIPFLLCVSLPSPFPTPTRNYNQETGGHSTVSSPSSLSW